MPIREVTFEPLEGLKNPKAVFSLVEDGRKVQTFKVDPINRRHQQDVAKTAGVELATVMGWLNDVYPADSTLRISTKKFLLGDPDATAPFSIYVRNIKQTRKEAKVHETTDPLADLREILPDTDEDTIVDWDADALDSLAMLDIDYHDPDARPTREWIETTLRASLHPLGAYWHFTRSGGVHVYYGPWGDPDAGGMDAAEVASLAALVWRSLDPTAGVEVKRVTRGLSAGVVIVDNPVKEDPGKAALSWLNSGALEANDDATSSWLADHGMELGQRLPHSQCPINPGDDSHGDPVVVSESGIYCHRCASLGHAKKGCRPGVVPWGVLVGGHDSSVLRTLVEKQAHWGHSKWVIEAVLGLKGDMARRAYSAALKAFHADKDTAALLPLVFHPNTEYLVRFPGWWGTVEEGHTYTQNIDDLLAVTPAANVVTADGVRVDKSSIAILKQTNLKHALVDKGYPAVQVIRGIRLWDRYSDPTRLVVSSPASWLEPYPPSLHPKYVPAKKRMPLEQAKKLLESVLPGINWQYLYALLMARACNEARYGLSQHLLVTGVSKAGKTSHVKLAAGILGDVVSEPVYTPDSDKFRSQVRDGSAAGSFVSFDEFIKNTTRHSPRMTAVQAMDPLLNFTPESMSHKMYLGPAALGHVSVCVWTETWVPEALRANTQIGRRVHFLNLVKKVEWEAGLVSNRISRIELIRTLSDEFAAACNAILSDVVDLYLQVPQTFDQLATQIGVTTLEKSPEFYDPLPKLLELFRCTCVHPDPDATDTKKFEGRGWKVIRREDAVDDLVSIWTHLADGGRSAWLTSRVVVEKDWGEILGSPKEVHCDLRNDGDGRVAIRFRVGTMQTPELVNEEIIGGMDKLPVPK